MKKVTVGELLLASGDTAYGSGSGGARGGEREDVFQSIVL